MLALAVSLLAWLLAALVAVLLLVVVTPLKVKGQFRSEPRRQLHVKAASLNGFLPYLTVFDSASKRAQKRKSKRKKKSKPKTRHGKPDGSSSRNMRLGKHIPALIVNVLRCISLDDLSGRIAFGLDDPADTGFVFGVFSPIAYGLPPSKRVHMHVQPVFDGATFSGKADVVFSVIPITLLPPFIRFGWRAFGSRLEP